MTEGDPGGYPERTAAIMTLTADQLRKTAARLLASADRARDAVRSQRLRALSERVVSQAQALSERASHVARGGTGHARSSARAKEPETP